MICAPHLPWPQATALPSGRAMSEGQSPGRRPQPITPYAPALPWQSHHPVNERSDVHLPPLAPFTGLEYPKIHNSSLSPGGASALAVRPEPCRRQSPGRRPQPGGYSIHPHGLTAHYALSPPVSSCMSSWTVVILLIFHALAPQKTSPWSTSPFTARIRAWVMQ